MKMNQLEAIIQHIERVRADYIKRFTDETGFPGYFEATGIFVECLNTLRVMQDWEIEDSKNVGDVIMKYLYSETIDPDCQFAEDEQYMNARTRSIMVHYNLCRKIDKHRWNLN